MEAPRHVQEGGLALLVDQAHPVQHQPLDEDQAVILEFVAAAFTARNLALAGECSKDEVVASAICRDTMTHVVELLGYSESRCD